MGAARQSDILVSQLPSPPTHALGVFLIPPPLPPSCKFLKFIPFFFFLTASNVTLFPLLPPFLCCVGSLGARGTRTLHGKRTRTTLKGGAGPQIQAGDGWALTHQPVTHVFFYWYTCISGDAGEEEVSDEV